MEVFNRIGRGASRVGPGIVFILSVVGAGDIVTNAALGAEYGVTLIWMLALTLVFRYVWIRASARYVLVTGETLLEGYSRLGRQMPWVLLGAITLTRHVSNLYKILLIGTVAQIYLEIPGEWGAAAWSLILTMTGFAMMFWGGYPVVERVFRLVLVLLGGALVTGAALSQPDPVEILKGSLIPNLPGHEGLYGLVLLIMALIGAEAGSMTNLTYCYFMQEKGWNGIRDMARQRLDLAFSVVSMFAMGALIQITASGTFGKTGLLPESTADLVDILAHGQGVVGWLVFGFGLLVAVFTGFVGGTTGYALIARDLVRLIAQRTGRNPGDGQWAYRGFVVFCSFSPLYILFLDVQPVWLLLTVHALTVVLIPFLGAGLLVITNRKDLMGEYRNGVVSNVILVLLVGVSLYLCLVQAWRFLSQG